MLSILSLLSEDGVHSVKTIFLFATVVVFGSDTFLTAQRNVTTVVFLLSRGRKYGIISF